MKSLAILHFGSRVAVVAAVLFSFTIGIQAASKYVRQGASGSGSGDDWANAYQSLPSSLARGNTYYIANGTYPGQTFADADSGTALIIIKKATGSDHGTETGWSQSYGDGGLARFTDTLTFNTGNYTIDGQTGGGPGSWTNGFGIQVAVAGQQDIIMINKGANNITVRHVDMQGNNGPAGSQFGFQMLACDNTLISYCYIHDTGSCLFFADSTNTTIEYCYGGSYISDSSNHAEIASIWKSAGINPGNWTIRYSIWTWLTGTGGFMMQDGSGLLVYGCVFVQLNSSQGGNGAIGTWTGQALTGIQVYNNTFINLQMPVIGILNSGDSGDIRNNIVYNSNVGTGAGFGFLGHDYNYYINIGDGPISESHAQIGSSNPFVNISGLNFSLTSATMPGDTSVPLQYRTDMFGNSGSNRGAVQAGSGQITRLPGPSNLRILHN